MQRNTVFALAVMTAGIMGGPAVAQSQETTPREPSLAEQANRLDRHRAELGDLVGRMDREMAAIYAAEDPETRARLMAEHRATMHEALAHMAALGPDWEGESIMAHTRTDGTPAPDRRHRFHGPRRRLSAPTSESLSQRVDRLEVRLEMMQVLVEDLVGYAGERK